MASSNIVRLAATCAVISVAALPGTAVAQRASSMEEFLGSLFTGAEQYENFNRMEELGRTETAPAARTPSPLPRGSEAALPASFRYKGKTFQTADFLTKTDTAAVLVLKDGKIVHERYSLTGGPKVRWLSMSVAKSFVSALIGVAVEEGKIASIEDPVTKYLQNLAGSAYDGVRIKDVLQMSSGARWNEEYGDEESDIARLSAVTVSGARLADFPATMKRERPPGTFNHYNSADTLVLGLLLEKATGQSLAKLTHDKLWEPLGAETPTFWVVDDFGSTMAYAGFNATARDYARLGELYRNGGQWRGRQVVPAAWVKASITPDAPHLQPGERKSASYHWGYGYQWWAPGGTDPQDFSAVGVYNQFIYVSPRDGVTIVKLSANSEYGRPAGADDEEATIELFREIAKAVP